MMTPPSPKKILVVQTAFIGDVVLTLPLVQQAARVFPDAQIHFLTIPTSVPLVETHANIQRVWVFKKRSQHRGVGALWRFAQQLREEQFEVALVPHRSLRSALLVWLAGIPVRIGFDRSAGRWLFTHTIPYQQQLHEIERNLQLLQPYWQWQGEVLLPRVFVTESDKAQVATWLKNQGLWEQPFVTLAPGSIWATKRWLPERFAELANRLVRSGWPVVLVGGPDDRKLGERIQAMAEVPLLNAMGVFNIRQSVQLLEHASVLVSNDTAPMHLAVAVRTPVVAIFGPTVPAFGFYPYGEGHRVVEDTTIACRPCGIHGHQRCPLGTHACMKAITVEQVEKAIQEVLRVQEKSARVDHNKSSQF